MKKKKLAAEINLNLVPMIDVTSFILLALGILVMSMKKEASLDNVLKLPEIVHAGKQDTTQLQIYILQASLMPGGYIMPDSTGLVAFMGKGSIPKECPQCRQVFRDEMGEYIPNTLLDISGTTPLASIKTTGKATDAELEQLKRDRPPAYLCAKCRKEISPYVRLDEIPLLLKAAKKKVVSDMIEGEKRSYFKLRGVEMPADLVKTREDTLDHAIPLMIKADNEAFYGRILQVVNMAKDTTCDIRKFAFITSAETVEKARKEARESAEAAKRGRR